MKNLRGFTIIELMITVVVAAILLTIGVPSFQNVIRENRLATQANELITALNLARSEAIRRGQSVSVTPIGGSWNNGWVVSAIDPATAVTTTLRSFDALGNNLSFTGGGASYTYLPTGFRDDFPGNAATPPDTYTLCDTSASGKRGRQVSVSPSGRPRINTADYFC